VQMSIVIVRTFIRLRELLVSDQNLARRLEKLETEQREVKSIVAVLADEIDQLRKPPASLKRPIGFTVDLDGKS